MARFITVHKLPAVATQDEVIEAGRAIIAASPNGSKWLKSWVVSEDDHFFCEWEAPEEGAIQAALKRAELFPVESIHSVVAVDPNWFKG